MPHTSALPCRAAPAAAVSGPAAPGRRPYSDATTSKLHEISSDLDMLLRDVSLGPVSHRQHERNVEAAEKLAAQLRAVFRSPTPRSEHPPLRQDGGKAWW